MKSDAFGAGLEPITEIIDSTGDGTNGLRGAHGVAVDIANNVYVTGSASNNVFKVALPTPTPTPQPSGDDGGCTVTPAAQNGAAAWWLLMPAMALWWVRRRRRV